jgi:hypothetical protein
MLVHIVADYGHGDLAFAEVAQRIKLPLPDAEAVAVPVPPFATLAAGFCVAQLGLNPPRPAPSSTTTSRPARTRRRPARATRGSAWPTRCCPTGCAWSG